MGDVVYFGGYPQGEDGVERTPIQWRMLHAVDGDVLLVSEYLLDCKRSQRANVDITWRDCDLRVLRRGVLRGREALHSAADLRRRHRGARVVAQRRGVRPVAPRRAARAAPNHGDVSCAIEQYLLFCERELAFGGSHVDLRVCAVMTTVLALDPSRRLVRRQLVDRCVALGLFGDAIAELERVSAHAREAGDAAAEQEALDRLDELRRGPGPAGA
ncbi:MAG: hypothetical protein HOO96_23950 [Polyangiaceae bacterium]|nr:hypothetical protein [Polyangiaceae bacterium]